MTGLPKLPGYNFVDPTLCNYHLSQTMGVKNGYKVYKSDYRGIGQHERDANSVQFVEGRNPVKYDPSLTYGRTKSLAQPPFIPHYALYDKKCLTYKAFFTETVLESPLENCRVRQVNIIYFLEDDTITVIEPRIQNSGINQGRLVRRAKIPKNNTGMYYNWKDLAVGKSIVFYGIVYHLVDCDAFTREYMASQGLEMGEPEEVPLDQYTKNKMLKNDVQITKSHPTDKLRQFLESDGKVLRFDAISEHGSCDPCDLQKYVLLYFLADDTITLKEIHGRNSGRDPNPIILKRRKVPKIYNDTPNTFPTIYMEITDEDISEFYQPKDLLVGNTICIMGRKMFLYDCDQFTRDYYKKVLLHTQTSAIDVRVSPKPPPVRPIPPHDGIGTLEDSLQNTLSFLPKPPRKDVIRQLINANKYLRYEMVMDAVHPEDEKRRFLLLHSLADSTCKIYEPAVPNSGILGGKYLRSTLLVKPGSDPLNPDYYCPNDFYIGAVVVVFQQRFIITGADLYVYRYMQANSHKFSNKVMDNIKTYLSNQGILKEDIEKQQQNNCEQTTNLQEDLFDKDNEESHASHPDKCIQILKCPAYEPEILQRNEDSFKHTNIAPDDYGISEVNLTCHPPVVTDNVMPSNCLKNIENEKHKHRCYGKEVSLKQHDVCEERRANIECPEYGKLEELKKEYNRDVSPILVSPPEYPRGSYEEKTVKFANPCCQNKYNLCSN